MSSEFLPTKLGEVLDFANGKTSPERSNNGRWPVYGSNGIIGTADATNSIADTIVIGRVGSYCGSVYLSATQCWVTDNAIRGNPKGNNSAVFLFYLLKHLNLNNWRSGSGQPLLNQSILNSIDVYIPEPPEQQEIGTFLSCIDDRIALLRETNATLEAIAQALFKSWFVDFDPVYARARGEQPLGLAPEVTALFPDSFEESALGMIPKGWQAEPLDEIADFLNGLALQKYPPEGDETLPVIKIAQLRKGDTVGADRASRNIKPEYIIQNGDVLFSWSGSLEVEVWCGGEGALNQHLFKVTSQRFQKWFYLRWTKAHLINFKHIAASKATTMGHIQRKHLTEAMVVVPSSQVLAEADKIFGPLLDQWINNAEQAQTLANLRDTLLPRLISGQLRLPDAEQQLKDLAV